MLPAPSTIAASSSARRDASRSTRGTPAQSHATRHRSCSAAGSSTTASARRQRWAASRHASSLSRSSRASSPSDIMSRNMRLRQRCMSPSSVATLPTSCTRASSGRGTAPRRVIGVCVKKRAARAPCMHTTGRSMSLVANVSVPYRRHRLVTNSNPSRRSARELSGVRSRGMAATRAPIPARPGEVTVGRSGDRVCRTSRRFQGGAARMASTEARPLALVTGASSGIGFELAKQFAENGYDLVVAAEDEELADAARDLAARGAQVEPVKVDLGTTEGVEELYRHVIQAGRPLDAAALNAGIGSGGSFDETPLEQELQLVDLNVRSTVQLAKYVVRDMARRGEGRILFTSSIASTMPGTFAAVYNASKSFVQSFALALREEIRDRGVTVTSLMPGPTETEFFERAGMTDTKLGSGEKDDPADVARDGFEALMAGKERGVSASLKTKVQGRAGRLMPDSVKAKMHEKQARPGSGD